MAVLRFSVELPARRERVWTALTTSAGLARWMCDRAESDPRPGGPLVMHWTGARASAEPFTGRWVQCDPLEACAWRGGHPGYPDGDSGTVVFELVALAQGTRVSVAHTLPDAAAYDPFLARYAEAWPRALARLTHHLTTTSPTS
jgi:uncharacterized protein YndB with AHSA1/START domain